MADTINNTNNSSEADDLFLPKDLDNDGNINEYTGYNVKWYKTLDNKHGCVLVKKNIFSGKWIVSSKRGLNFSLPLFTKRILVPTWERIKEYQWDNHVCKAEDMAKTTDGITPNVKLSLKVQITNPILYQQGGKEKFPELKGITEELLSHFIAKKSFNDISQKRSSLAEFDPTGRYLEFERKTGIKVNDLIFKATLPKDLQDLADKAVKEKMEREAQKEKLEATKEKARADAEIKRIEAEAEANRIKIIENAKAEAWTAQMRTFVQYLEEKGILTEKISELLTEQLKLKTITDSNANAIFSIGDSNNQAANIAAGIRASNNNQANSRIPINISNSEQLMNDLRFCSEQGNITEDRYNAVIKLLMNPEQKKIIDMASKEMYNKWFLEKVLEASPTNSESQTTGTPHPRR